MIIVLEAFIKRGDFLSYIAEFERMVVMAIYLVVLCAGNQHPFFRAEGKIPRIFNSMRNVGL